MNVPESFSHALEQEPLAGEELGRRSRWISHLIDGDLKGEGKGLEGGRVHARISIYVFI